MLNIKNDIYPHIINFCNSKYQILKYRFVSNVPFLDNNRNRTLSNDEVEGNAMHSLATNVVQSNKNNDANASLSFENSFTRDIIDF